MRRFLHRSVAVALCLASLSVPAGCSATGTAARGQAAKANDLPLSSRRHFDRTGEAVEIRLFTYEEWKDDCRYKDLGVELPKKPAPISTNNNFALGAAGVAAALVGVVVDAVKVELEKEAAKHVQQYTDILYADDFWAEPGVPRYAGFELIRTTSAFSDDRPASRIIFMFDPSDHDRRLMLIRPVYLKVNSAAAKVSAGLDKHRRFTIQVNALMETVVLNEKLLLQTTTADASFAVRAYSLDASNALRASFDPEKNKWSGPLAQHVAGYFVAPLINFGRGPSPGWYSQTEGGAFKLSIAVTETDDSRARETILKFSEFVGSQKETLQQAASGLVSGSPSGGPTPPGPGGT